MFQQSDTKFNISNIKGKKMNLKLEYDKACNSIGKAMVTKSCMIAKQTCSLSWIGAY